MPENENKPVFWGTYFNKDGVMTLSRWAAISAWVILAIYALDFFLLVSVLALQFSSGFLVEKGDLIYNLSNIYVGYLLRPVPGIVYFFLLMGVSRLLLVFLDIEDNTRRAARAGK